MSEVAFSLYKRKILYVFDHLPVESTDRNPIVNKMQSRDMLGAIYPHSFV